MVKEHLYHVVLSPFQIESSTPRIEGAIHTGEFEKGSLG